VADWGGGMSASCKPRVQMFADVGSFLQEIFEGRMMGKRLEVEGEYRCYMI